MQTRHQFNRHLTVARATFDAVTVSIGGLYLATHSVAVTLIGTAAATAITCRTIRVPYSKGGNLTGIEQSETPPPEQTENAISNGLSTFSPSPALWSRCNS